jgi:hypothetical protein
LILQFLLPNLLYSRIIHSLIPHDFVKSWVLFSILPSLAQISALLLIEFVSSCMLLQIPLNAFFATLKVRYPMVFISLEVPLLLYMVLQMQIRLVVLMIASLRVAILFSLVKHRFHGNPTSNVQLPAPPLRLSTKP